jgi:hypothetical protein
MYQQTCGITQVNIQKKILRDMIWLSCKSFGLGYFTLCNLTFSLITRSYQRNWTNFSQSITESLTLKMIMTILNPISRLSQELGLIIIDLLHLIDLVKIQLSRITLTTRVTFSSANLTLISNVEYAEFSGSIGSAEHTINPAVLAENANFETKSSHERQQTLG